MGSMLPYIAYMDPSWVLVVTAAVSFVSCHTICLIYLVFFSVDRSCEGANSRFPPDYWVSPATAADWMHCQTLHLEAAAANRTISMLFALPGPSQSALGHSTKIDSGFGIETAEFP